MGRFLPLIVAAILAVCVRVAGAAPASNLSDDFYSAIRNNDLARLSLGPPASTSTIRPFTAVTGK